MIIRSVSASIVLVEALFVFGVAMFGFYFTEHDVTASGVIFDDDQVYVHEPISDTFSSKEDLQRDHPTGVFQLVGPVVATDLARIYVERDYHAALQQVENYRKRVEAEYQHALTMIDRRESKQEEETVRPFRLHVVKDEEEAEAK